ncbi:hypothetical protein ACFVBP_21670 [Nocardioides sp. NPDC057764]|uniref:hypothetical protein n=1 Tax=Nocardioides sp. NPDC057764 TaxID=3346243 RepID=UPI00366D529F
MTGLSAWSSLTEKDWDRYLGLVGRDPEGVVGYLVEETPFGAVLWSETRWPVAMVLGAAEDSSPVRAQRVARERNQVRLMFDGRSLGGLRGFLGAMFGLLVSLLVVAPVSEDFLPANNYTAVFGMVTTFLLVFCGYVAAGFGERIRNRKRYRIFDQELAPAVKSMHRIGQMMEGHPSEPDVRTAVLHTMWAQADTGLVDAGAVQALEDIERQLAEAVEAREERDAAVDQEISHLRDSAVPDEVPEAGDLVDESWWGRRRVARARAEQEAQHRAEQWAAGARAHLVDRLEVDIEADRSVAREYRTRSKDS